MWVFQSVNGRVPSISTRTEFREIFAKLEFLVDLLKVHSTRIGLNLEDKIAVAQTSACIHTGRAFSVDAGLKHNEVLAE